MASGISHDASVSNSSQPAVNQSIDQLTVHNQEHELKAGLFYADADIQIANRICDALNRNGCKAQMCDFYDAGLAVFEAIESFVSEQQMVLWLATRTSLNDKGILQSARHIAQYASITRRDLGIRFVTVQPREYLHSRLPLTLDAYTTLREDLFFEMRLSKTIASVQKRARGDYARENSTATPNATVDTGVNELRNLPPNSDDLIAEPGLVSSCSGNTNLCATPDNKSLVGEGTSGQKVSIQAMHIVHIHGDNSNVQVGTDNVSVVRKRENKREDSDLPPV
ncbi:uncharacterized protein LOC120334261 isoform X1 [Styela clava]